MNLLSLILVFLAIIICGAVAYIAWELTAEETGDRQKKERAPKGREPDLDDQNSGR